MYRLIFILRVKYLNKLKIIYCKPKDVETKKNINLFIFNLMYLFIYIFLFSKNIYFCSAASNCDSECCTNDIKTNTGYDCTCSNYKNPITNKQNVCSGCETTSCSQSCLYPCGSSILTVPTQTIILATKVTISMKLRAHLICIYK